MLRRAYNVIEIKEYDDQKREFEGIATTVGTDRYGDVVESEGAEFALPLPLLWQHNASQPVGHVLEAKPTKKNIKVKGVIAKLDAAGTLKDRLDEAWHSLKLGLVRHLSVGFNPLEFSRIEDSEKFGLKFTRWEWLELSLVTIPANADASITSIKHYDTELLRAASGNTRKTFLPGVVLADLVSPGVTGKSDKSAARRRFDGVPLVKL
jgi:HK97 family phage prohead protease